MMRTSREILKEYGVKHHNDELERDDIECAMREYAIELLNHLMSNSEEYIYIDDGEGGDYSRPEEAVFNYEAIEKLKQELK